VLRAVVLRWLINTFALAIVAAIVPGIESAGMGPTLLAALVLGLLNALVRPILFLVTLPINLLTLGLFTFVINGLMLKLTASFVSGFIVEGFAAAVFGALLLSIVSFVMSLVVAEEGRFAFVTIERRERF
jgi:putative membrane protein